MDLKTLAVIKLTPIAYDPRSRISICGKYQGMIDNPIVKGAVLSEALGDD